MAVGPALIVLKIVHERIKLGAPPKKGDLLPQVREHLVDGDEVLVGVNHVESCGGESVAAIIPCGSCCELGLNMRHTGEP